MSTNVDHLTLREMEDFAISLKGLTLDGLDLTIDVTAALAAVTDPEEILSPIIITGLAENFKLEGEMDLENKVFRVSHLSYGGEHSGYNWDEFESILHHSTGKLVASVAWEDGQIWKMTVTNGLVSIRHDN